MKQGLKILSSLLVVITLSLQASGPTAGASLSDQLGAARERAQALGQAVEKQQTVIDAIQRDQATTQEELQTSARELEGINADQRAVKARIQDASERLGRIEARHAALVDQQRQLDYTLALLEQELANGEADLRARREALGRQVAEAYRTESTTLLEQVLTADSFSDVVTETSAYLAYADQDAQAVHQIEQDQQALDSLRLLTTSTRLRTDQLRRRTLDTQAQVEARKQELERAQHKLDRLERRTERIQRAQQARYRTLVTNERQARRLMRESAAAERQLKARIAGLVRRAQVAAARRSAVRPGGGGFFAWPVSGIVTQEYGCTGFYLEPPLGSCAHFHDGIDIANGPGTPVRAAADGVVAFIGARSDGSIIAVLGHAGGYETSYGHLLPRYVVRAGQFLKQGAIVGYMGCTGTCTGPHVHFEVLKDGQTINPRLVL